MMDITSGEDVQNSYLTNAKNTKMAMTIYMMNGFQVKGKIIDFDRFTILVDNNGKKRLLYKNAVSTIEPDNQETDKRVGSFGRNGYMGYR